MITTPASTSTSFPKRRKARAVAGVRTRIERRARDSRRFAAAGEALRSFRAADRLQRPHDHLPSGVPGGS